MVNIRRKLKSFMLSGIYLGYHQCNDDEYILGSKCIKIFTKKQTWKLAKEKCVSINSNLIRLHDIIQEKKLAYFILTNNQQQPTSFWISDEKDKYDGKKFKRTWLNRDRDSIGLFYLYRELMIVNGYVDKFQKENRYRSSKFYLGKIYLVFDNRIELLLVWFVH
jgi:hypothetical protein